MGEALVSVAKPLTFMNKSGVVLPYLLRKSHATPQRLLVVVDTLDLPAGTIRMKRRGGDGGHRGLQSVSAALGTNDYPRLYLGIGRPRDRSAVVDYVLARPHDSSTYEQMYDRAASICLDYSERGVERVMNEVNRRTPG